MCSSRESGIGERLRTPCKVISAHSDAVYAMVATEAFCVSGATGQISVSTSLAVLDVEIIGQRLDNQCIDNDLLLVFFLQIKHDAFSCGNRIFLCKPVKTEQQGRVLLPVVLSILLLQSIHLYPLKHFWH